MLRALHTITSYPPELSNPIFTQYPAMKFGEAAAVDHFARLLLPEALRLIGTAPRGEWVLTSPPVRNLPSGANLLCRRLHGLLGHVGIEPLKLVDAALQFQTEAEFRDHGDYAKLDYKTRCRAQFGIDEVAFDHDALRGKHVIFVNDINVTGAQMHWITAVLRQARPRRIDWLLVLNTAKHIGRRFAHLESEINRSRFGEREEMISFLHKAELRYTGKLVARLLDFGANGLERIFESLDTAKRHSLLRAMFEDGSYSSEFLEERLAAVL